MASIIILLYVIARKYPRRKKMVGIVSTAITLGIMVLLGHGVYNTMMLRGIQRMVESMMVLYSLFGVNLAILILSIKLIRKSSSRSQSN